MSWINFEVDLLGLQFGRICKKLDVNTPIYYKLNQKFNKISPRLHFCTDFYEEELKAPTY